MSTGRTHANSAIEAIEKRIQQDSESLALLSSRKSELLTKLVHAQVCYADAEKRIAECRLAIMSLRADELEKSNAARRESQELLP